LLALSAPPGPVVTKLSENAAVLAVAGRAVHGQSRETERRKPSGFRKEAGVRFMMGYIM
jgi:hypothetical protein